MTQQNEIVYQPTQPGQIMSRTGPLTLDQLQAMAGGGLGFNSNGVTGHRQTTTYVNPETGQEYEEERIEFHQMQIMPLAQAMQYQQPMATAATVHPLQNQPVLERQFPLKWILLTLGIASISMALIVSLVDGGNKAAEFNGYKQGAQLYQYRP